MKAREPSPPRPHSGRPIVTITDGAIFIRCCRLHLVERVPTEAWESHWLHDRVFDPHWQVECSIGN